MSYTKLLTKVKVLILAAILIAQSQADQIWDHAVYLNEDYLLQWTVKEPDILFEVQVKAHGYVGFGFSRDGTTIYGADVFIGWIDEGHIFFYVSFDVSSIIKNFYRQTFLVDLVIKSNMTCHTTCNCPSFWSKNDPSWHKRQQKKRCYLLANDTKCILWLCVLTYDDRRLWCFKPFCCNCMQF